MAFLGEQFSTDSLPESDNNFDPVPAGWYTVRIMSAEVKNTKAGNGQYISVRYDIVAPSFQGRVVWGNLNIKNPNAEAERIGRQQLGDLMRASGLKTLSDTDQLMGATLQVKVTVKDDPVYGPGNEIKGFKSVSGTAHTLSAAPGTSQASQPAHKPASEGTPPWLQK